MILVKLPAKIFDINDQTAILNIFLDGLKSIIFGINFVCFLLKQVVHDRRFLTNLFDEARDVALTDTKLFCYVFFEVLFHNHSMKNVNLIL